jgi:hypothetical protein
MAFSKTLVEKTAMKMFQTYSLQTTVENNFEICRKNTKSMFKK